MRILAIRGQDLTSLAGSFEVDFEAEPLASAGIFAITGPTGAGKSTLLDAICLALFNQVPRLISLGTGQVGAADGEMLSLSDTRALLRHRAASGFAEVDFIGTDGGRYRARWSVKRARGRADGTLQNVVQDFTNLDTGERIGGGTRTETLAAIRTRLGLSAEEFSRAVMLAQGGFNAFIDANPGARAELLEKLTGTSIYTRLGAAARQKGDLIRQDIAAIEARITAQGGLDDIARGEAETRLADAIGLHGAAQDQLAGLQRSAGWYATAARLAARVDAAAAALTSARQRQEEAEPRRLALASRKRAWSVVPLWRASRDADEKARLAATQLEQLLEAAETARKHAAASALDETAAVAVVEQAELALKAQQPQLDSARELDRRITALDEALAPLLAAAETAAAAAEAKATAHGEAAAVHDAASVQVDELTAWLEANASHRSVAARHGDLTADLNEFRAEAARVLALTAEQADQTRQIEVARLTDEAAQASEAEARQLVERATAERDLARSCLPGAGELEAVAAQRDRMSEIEPCLLAVERFENELAGINQRIEASETEIGQLDALITAASSRRAEIAAALPAAIARHDEALRASALSAAASEHAAQRMRQALIPGQPCPVCGGTEHTVEALAAMLDGRADEDRDRVGLLAAELSRLKQEHAVVEDRELQNRTRRDDAATRLTEARNLVRGAEGELEEANGRLSAALSRCEIAIDANRAALRLLVGARIGDADMRRQQLVAAQTHEREAQQALEAGSLLLAEKEAARRASAAVLRELDRTTVLLSTRLTEARRRRDHVATSLESSLTPIFEWRTEPDPVATLDRIVSEWRAKAAALIAAQAAMPALVEAKHRAELARQQAEGEARTSALGVSDRQAERAARAAERAALLGGESVETVTRRFDDAIRAASEAREATRRATNAGREAATAAQARCEQAQLVLSRDQSDAASRKDALEGALRSREIEVALVAEVADGGETAIVQEEQALAAVSEAVIVAAAEHRSREQDHAAHLATSSPALPEADLAEAIAAAGNVEEAARSTMDDAQLVIRQDDAARAATASLRASLEAAHAAGKVWLQLDALIGDATGSKFRRFAQGLTLEHLLLHANARLGELKPRYALERVQGGDMLIQVIDNDLAGEVRGLSNLSGGERFLVSLALALGLAEMSTSQGLIVESLFIDEGFGALDSASLGQAISMLEQLHATGRRVGVISHIDDVKERIAVKIKVTPESNGKSAIEVVGD